MVTLLGGVEVVGHGVACQVLGPLAGIPEGECTVEGRFVDQIEFALDVVHCPCLLRLLYNQYNPLSVCEQVISTLFSMLLAQFHLDRGHLHTRERGLVVSPKGEAHHVVAVLRVELNQPPSQPRHMGRLFRDAPRLRDEQGRAGDAVYRY